MRRPVMPGWAKKQTPTPFLYTKENDKLKLKADFGVFVGRKNENEGYETSETERIACCYASIL